MSDIDKVKVIFRKVIVLKNPDFLSDGDFFFIASVDGQPVGDRNRIFGAGKGDTITLPQPLWSKELNVTGRTQFRLLFRGIDQDGFLNGDDDDVGTVDRLVKVPFHQEINAFGQTAFFRLIYDIEVPVEGQFGRHPPNDIVAARVIPGGLDVTTVATTKFLVRAEAHSVVPVPPAPGSPVRPPVPAGVTEDKTNEVAKTITPASPINLLPNPAVIPILTPAQQALPVAQQKDLCARIELTYFRPNTMSFTANDPRLKWTARPLAGGSVNFLDAPPGTPAGTAVGAKIFVVGVAAGEVLLECRLAREILAVYRALVRPLRQIPCRCNIIDGINPAAGGPLIRPLSSPADIASHLQVANIFLRQMALELVLDTNVTIANKHGLTVTATPTAGIFRVRAPIGRTRNASTPSTDLVTQVNFRANVFNFAYIISDPAGNLGAGNHFPNSTTAPPAPNARAVVTENAKTPTSSWIKPCGVTPDGAAGNTTLVLIRRRLPQAGLFSMYVTDGNAAGTPPVAGSNASALTYGGTIAHEFGHCLNLGHRVEGTNNTSPTPGVDGPAGTPAAQLNAGGIFFDGVLHPPHENVMHWIAPSTIAHDFDILQAIGARSSPLVPQP